MNKKLKFLSIFFLGINSIIGSGIFLLPSEIYKNVGLGCFLTIVIAGSLAFGLSLCFAECASRFTQDGSAFLYCKNAFGGLMGFEVGIFTWLVSIISWAAETQGFITILSSLYPTFKDPFYNKVAVLVISITLGILNYFGVKFSKILNNLITVTKLIPLLLFIIIGIFYIHLGDFSHITRDTVNIIFNKNFGNSILIIFYAFTGFDLLAIAAEDMDNPQKNLPRALIGVISFCCLFYLLIFVVSIGICGGSLSHTNVPIAYATYKILGKIGFTIVTITTLISIGGVTIALSFIGPRSGVAMAEEGYLPKALNKQTKYGTPGISILITTTLVVLCACLGNFIYLASLTVVARFIEYIPTALAVLVLRKKYKNTPPGYKIPFGDIIPLFSIILSIIIFFFADFNSILIIFAIIFINFFIFYFKKLKL